MYGSLVLVMGLLVASGDSTGAFGSAGWQEQETPVGSYGFGEIENYTYGDQQAINWRAGSNESYADEEIVVEGDMGVDHAAAIHLDGPHCSHCESGALFGGSGCGCGSPLGCGLLSGRASSPPLPSVWRTRCDMPQHFPYFPYWNTYYYFRPYNHVHVLQQKELITQLGGDRHNPYDNRFFEQFYEGIEPPLGEKITRPLPDDTGEAISPPSPLVPPSSNNEPQQGSIIEPSPKNPVKPASSRRRVQAVRFIETKK